MATRSISSPSPESGEFLPHSPSWQQQPWLWPHLFSLDAPLVAVLWQVLLLRDLAVPLSRGELVVLALCVWCVYVVDRVLDVMRPRLPGWEPARKAFYRKHLRLAAITALGLLAAILPLAYHLLKRATFQAGLALAVPLIFYLIFIHLAPVRWRSLWPREMAVAGVFTGGVFLAAWVAEGKNFQLLWAPALLFLLLCWANCCAIETWEWQINRLPVNGEPSRSARWITGHLSLLAFGVACLSAFMERMALTPPDFSLAAFLGGVALSALALCRSRLPMNSLRVAADLALCAPLPVLLFNLFS